MKRMPVIEPFRAARQAELTAPYACCWPVAAQSWYGGAFPLCGMALCSLADLTSLRTADASEEQTGRRVLSYQQ